VSVQQAAISQPLVAAKANEPLPENIYFADLDKFYPANNAAELRPYTQKAKRGRARYKPGRCELY